MATNAVIMWFTTVFFFLFFYRTYFKRDGFQGWNDTYQDTLSTAVCTMYLYFWSLGHQPLWVGLEDSSKKIFLGGDNVAVPLPRTKAIVWCFCHQNLRWVDVLLALIISGMDPRLQNTTWQRCCKSDDMMLLAILGHETEKRVRCRSGLWCVRHCQEESSYLTTIIPKFSPWNELGTVTLTWKITVLCLKIKKNYNQGK